MMRCSSPLAGLVVLLVAGQLPPQLWAGSTCPAASGDGTTDDTIALQCLLQEGDADEAIHLTGGATYLITDTLRPTKRKVYGGVSPEGSVTTVRCECQSFDAFTVRGDFAVHGIRVVRCKTGFTVTGNLTLVDSTINGTHKSAVVADFTKAGHLTLVNCTINNTDFDAVWIRNSGPRGHPRPTFFLTGSRILNARSDGFTMSDGIKMEGDLRLVMEKSEIARATGNGVHVKGTDEGSVLEAHSSDVRECGLSAIVVREGVATSVLVAGRSSIEGRSGPCISLIGGIGHRVNITGGSRIQACHSGVLLRSSRNCSVMLTGGSLIRGCLHALVLKGGRGDHVAIQDGSRIQESLFTGVKVTGEASLTASRAQKVEVSGHSAIEDSGGSGILVEAGSEHEVSITDGSWLRKSGGHGVLLAARSSRLRLEGSAIRESQGSAVRATLSTLSSAARFGPAHKCAFAVSLQSAYFVHNGGGFQCESACAEGEISGVVYLNGVDFDNRCSGKLSRRGPLWGVAEFGALKAHVQWCSLGVAAGASFLPWWRVYFRAGHSPVLGAVVALLVLTIYVWVVSMLDLWHVMRALESKDLAKEGARLLFAVACFVPVCAPLMSFAQSQRWHRRWQNAKVLELLRALEASLWQGHSEEVQLLCARLAECGLAPAQIQGKVSELRRQQSLESGVSVAYLLSPDFLSLARARTGLQNPTFLQMKDPFWSGEDAIGKGVLCPRDGRPGCALVDTLHPRHRQRSTHFLSWVWRYPVLLVQEALGIWVEEEGLDPSQTFLFMCFFVNNQFRILIQGTRAGSDDLETTFERNLLRIGHLVALLDHWRQPLYLSRIWTIYEQYVAAKLQLPVTVILNREAGESLIEELDKGKDGIIRVTGAFRNVDAETAEASVKADEEHVKAVICQTTGFDFVNKRVRRSMNTWVGSVVRRHMDALVGNAGEDGAVADSDQRALRISCTRLEGATSMAALEVRGSI